MEVPLGGETNNLIGHISSFWFLDDVLELCEVLEPPSMYQQAGAHTFLLESRGDANHKLLDDDRFVLTECRLTCIGAHIYIYIHRYNRYIYIYIDTIYIRH